MLYAPGFTPEIGPGRRTNQRNVEVQGGHFLSGHPFPVSEANEIHRAEEILREIAIAIWVPTYIERNSYASKRRIWDLFRFRIWSARRAAFLGRGWGLGSK